MGWPAQLLPSSKVFLWKSICCLALLSWACSSLTGYISFFVANENEDCSALTNEIIVTMHTFQDVSRPEGLRKGRAGEWWTR